MSFLTEILNQLNAIEGFKLDLHELLIILIAICVILCFTYMLYRKSKPTKRGRYNIDLSSPPRRSKLIN